jgi:hypothetical protein
MIQEFRHDHLTVFAGLPVHEFHFADPAALSEGDVPGDAENWAWRIALEDADATTFAQVFATFLATVDTSRVKALILGYWLAEYDMERESSSATEPLLANAERFPALESLFVGDMISEQIEVSWIYQSDPGPVLEAFPRLREFGLRGTTNLTMAPVKHAGLRELTFQGGGLPPEVVRALGASELPSLTGIELYLGESWYNGGATPEDLAAILHGQAFPQLRHLGLRDSADQDDIAAALAHAPVVAQLETLDLSLGNLSDQGAAALLAGQPLTHLKSLDLHHHYLTEEMMQRIWAALPGVAVNLDEQEQPDGEQGEWEDSEPTEQALREQRYIAVAE